MLVETFPDSSDCHYTNKVRYIACHPLAFRYSAKLSNYNYTDLCLSISSLEREHEGKELKKALTQVSVFTNLGYL